MLDHCPIKHVLDEFVTLCRTDPGSFKADIQVIYMYIYNILVSYTTGKWAGKVKENL